MTDRLAIDRLLRELYNARVRGDLDAVCRTFSRDAEFRIAGASHANPIAITAAGIDGIRSWLALLIKAFRLKDHTILATIIDGAKAAVHWRATIHSRITGTAILTDVVDLIEVRDGHIASYVEFFAPR
jgi:ketosteroid isomerase-like protein